MPTRLATLLAALLLFVAAPVSAQSTGDPLLDEFIVVSGMEHCIMLGAGDLDAMLDPERTSMPSEEFDAFAAVMRHAFQPDAMRADGVAKLREMMQADTVRAVVAWLKEPLGQRLVAMESAAAEAGEAAMQAYVQTLNPADEAVRERAAVIVQLHESLDSVERSIEMIAGMTEAMLVAVNEFVPDAERMTDEQRAQIVGAQEDQYRQSMPGYMVAHSFYTYREASIADLEAYVRFLNSPAGRWYARATVAASSASMQNVGKRLGEALATELSSGAAVPQGER